jgi:ATP-binding cassette subfamily F protein 3
MHRLETEKVIMITFDLISKQYGSTVILENSSFAFNPQERTGLVGVNGSGKTTILRMLGGAESPDKGTIKKASDLSIGYLPQEVEVLDSMTPLEIVLEPFKNVLNFESHLEHISNSLHESNVKESLNKIDKLYADMQFHDAYSLEARAKMILGGLGVPEKSWTEPVQYLSGGYRMRTVLGRLLLTSPDFLLLDEPTNHLDMDSLVWLEKFLGRHKGGMLIVSHDRDFLNRITTYTAEISNRALTLYKGNYDAYVAARDEAEAAALSRTKNLETKIAQAERFVERFKAKATKATQAQSRMKLLEKLKDELPEMFESEKSIDFTFPEPKPSGNIPLKFVNCTAGYGEKVVINNLSLLVNRGDKIAIVGPNGAGKSTLLKCAASLLEPKSGTMEIGHNATVRYFGQHQLEQLDPEITVHETVARQSVSTDKTFIRNILGAFLFSGDTVDKYVKVLSGGEKARLVLATILSDPGNVLLLDEPTNHLDIRSIEMLGDAMRDFGGTIVFVSHDEYFISKVANRIIEVRPDRVRDFPGTLHDYRDYIERMFADESEASQKGNSDVRNVVDDVAVQKEQRIKDRETRKKLGRTIEKLEREIAQAETKITNLTEQLNNPSNALNHVLLHETSTAIASAEDALLDLMSELEMRQAELAKMGAE